MFVIYGIGLAALAGCLALLYFRALYLAPMLKMGHTEKINAISHAAYWSIMAVTGLVSALYAWLTPGRAGGYAGFVYFTLAVSMPAAGRYFRGRVKAVQRQTEED